MSETAGVAAAAAALSSVKLSRCDPAVDQFGNLPLIQSASEVSVSYTVVGNINASMAGQRVTVRARLHNVRGKKSSSFVVLRQGFHTIQGYKGVNKGAEDAGAGDLKMIEFINQVNSESIVQVEGVVQAGQVHSCTVKDAEIHVDRFYVVSEAASPLPVSVVDAGRTAEETRKLGKQVVTVGRETRLNFRWIELRTPANLAIFRIQSMVGQLFREFLLQNNFVEIHSPKLLGGASESGSACFNLDYFGRPACLAQSPQLYKQMAIVADFERVFEIGPVFRAENSDTHRHLCEFVGLDMEMAFKDHYYEVLDVIDGMFRYIFDGLNTRCRTEIDVVRAQFEGTDLVYRRDKTLRISFKEGIELLRGAGCTIGDLDDINTEQEKKLGQLVFEKYGTQFFIMDKFPASARPFYTMPDPVDPNYTNSYDIYVRGEEIVSGAQRIHDAQLLLKQIRAKNMNPASVQAYVDSFTHGAPPHAGCGVGLERVVMLFLGLDDIRRSSLFPRDPSRLTP